MILDNDNTVEERINNNIFTPIPPDIQSYRDTMKVRTIDWKRWISEVPLSIFKDIFTRQIEIQQEHRGRTGTYIYGIEFNEGYCLNFIFQGINHSDHLGFSNGDQVAFDIVLSDYYLRDQEAARRAFIANQRSEFIRYYFEPTISCSLDIDKENILEMIHKFVILHSKNIIFQSYFKFAEEERRKYIERMKGAGLYGVSPIAVS